VEGKGTKIEFSIRNMLHADPGLCTLADSDDVSDELEADKEDILERYISG